jgi:hypothetical protein
MAEFLTNSLLETLDIHASSRIESVWTRSAAHGIVSRFATNERKTAANW